MSGRLHVDGEGRARDMVFSPFDDKDVVSLVVHFVIDLEKKRESGDGGETRAFCSIPCE